MSFEAQIQSMALHAETRPPIIWMGKTWCGWV